MQNIPEDYYRRLHEAEERHWWSVGMRRITASLLEGRLQGALLDAGCGTGGLLAWARAQGTFERLCGTDLSSEAVELARRSVPEADVHVAPLHELPFADGSFDVVVLADVLQHVAEAEVDHGLQELRRVLRHDGALLVRTNGSRRGRRVRADWRLYDTRSLADELTRAGFRIERVTHTNMVLSAFGREPAAPTESSCGIPAPAGRLRSVVGSTLLRAEAGYLRAPGRSLPRGHTLFALATRAAT
jgi:SAM-dependent methyltransferase